MPRPKDLPRPVRDHKAHEVMSEVRRAAEMPGPGSYEGFGVSKWHRDKRLGTFGRAVRFAPGQLCPEDLRTREARENFLDNPGPIYDPQLPKSGEGGVLLARSKRRALTETEATVPGPGTYESDDPEHWKSGVHFTQGPQRVQAHIEGSGPLLNVAKAKPRMRSCVFARASRFPSDPPEIDVAPALTSLQAIDQAMHTTRPRSATHITFPKSGSSSVRAATPDASTLGPAYDVMKAEKLIRPSSGAVKFGTGKRLAAAPVSSGEYTAFNNFDKLSTRSTGAKISFTRARQRVDPPPPIDPDVPVACYYPNLRCVSAGDKAPTIGTSKRTELHRDLVGGPGPGGNTPLTDASVWEGARVTMATSTRPSLHPNRESPGPGAYNPKKQRPHSAALQFPRSPRMPADKEGMATPAAIYNPRIELVRPQSATAPKFNTGGRQSSSPSRADPRSYTPKYTAVDRIPRSAVLYLTS